jgi:predicted component of type VI protein secretion system
MSVLMVNDWVDFNSLKTLIDVTDGNLASQVQPLKEYLIEVRKQLAAVNQIPVTELPIKGAKNLNSISII